MRFGVREICDVVLKAKAATKIGNKVFYKNEPVIYFDSLKTSSMEGAATTVYAQGGRGNSRLVAWEGERTVTFTMEDALISPEGFMILSGAGLVEASANSKIFQHVVETTDKFDPNATKDDDATDGFKIYVEKQPHFDANEDCIYVMARIGDEIVSEPYYVSEVADKAEVTGDFAGLWAITVASGVDCKYCEDADTKYTLVNDASFNLKKVDSFLVDYYTVKTSGARQIEITPDKFGGNYYLEASTLFRDTNGVDMPAEFIIPNCKIQSNFTFTMASSGDPSTFTFTMDAFPDYTRFDKSKKVLAAIQIIDAAGSMDLHRESTKHDSKHDLYFN
jgi:hypothetical protein